MVYDDDVITNNNGTTNLDSNIFISGYFYE